MSHQCEAMGAQSGDETRRSRAGGRIDWDAHRDARAKGVTWGFFSALLLAGLYVGILSIGNSLEHVADQFLAFWYFMVPLVLGFSLQMGLFAYARHATRNRGDTRARGVVASGGASALSMVACCAHHLADVLPVLGVVGTVTVLATYQNIFLLLGVLSNLVGLVYILGLLKRHGLFPRRWSLLAAFLGWPVERALPATITLALVVFVTNVVVTVF